MVDEHQKMCGQLDAPGALCAVLCLVVMKARAVYSWLLHVLQAARELHTLGPKYVLVKGGHLIEPASSDPHTPASADHNPSAPGSSAGARSVSSAPQTSPEATSATQDSPAQSSESANTASRAEPAPSPDASFSEKKNGNGRLPISHGPGGTQPNRHSAATEQATEPLEGKHNASSLPISESRILLDNVFNVQSPDVTTVAVIITASGK